MTGNVSEWCHNMEGNNSVNDRATIRGGNFDSTAEQCLLGKGTYHPLDTKNWSLGFRLAL